MRLQSGHAVLLWCLALGASLAGSHFGAAPAVSVRVQLPRDEPAAGFAMPRGVRSARVWSDSEMTLLVDPGATPLSLRLGDSCPVTIPQTAEGGSAAVAAKAWINVGGDRAQVGFDEAFAIDVEPGCAEARDGRVEWRQIEGPPLPELHAEDNGFRLRARTGAFEPERHGPLPWGIVPLSPRTQGRYVLEAQWTGNGHAPVRRTVVVTAAARATGQPSVALGQRLFLGGNGWHVASSPPGAHAVVRSEVDTTFEPDVVGRWVLADGGGRELAVRVGTHDRTPLDCGRSDCHAAEADAAKSSPMTHALESRLRAGSDVGCMFDCHVTGERGLHDGGFLDIAARAGEPLSFSHWSDLPRTLLRASGVTCTACHGPAAIPEPGARRFALRADVCATCHDAPPTYVHVEQWRASRMATSDATPRTRTDAACVRCHTTSGFLTSLGVWKKAEGTEEEAVGVACVACHEPHGPHVGEALVRAVALPSALATAPVPPSSAVCVGCHSPSGDSLPSASAAAIWLGRAVLPGGEVVQGPAPHAATPEGCLGCHGHSPANGTAKTNHSFRADPSACRSCHQDRADERAVAASGALRDRALVLWRTLAASPEGPPPGQPLHASGDASGATGSTARARYELSLVLEDPAAAAHNAPFARMLLEDAQRRIEAPP